MQLASSHVAVENIIAIATSVWGFYLLAKFAKHRWSIDDAIKELEESKVLLEQEREQKKAERAARIHAEQELRRLQVSAVATGTLPVAASSGTDAASQAVMPDPGSIAFPLRPIGHMQSCFSQRNGTPRQPLLVPLARSRLQLEPGVPGDSFQGLEQYSHCWVLYVFHENTDLDKVLQGGDRSAKHAKIAVPRLNGAKMGVLATRSPHRPVPIGLSVARVLAVEGNSLILGGADIVDGSPVLDIKPYLPFCDGVRGATAPAWVAAEADDEPLKVAEVAVPPGAVASIRGCWEARQRARKSAVGPPLYGSSEEYMRLVVEVLSRDIRSLRKRLGITRQLSSYHVVLDGIDIAYAIDDDKEGAVTVLGASIPGPSSDAKGFS